MVDASFGHHDVHRDVVRLGKNSVDAVEFERHADALYLPPSQFGQRAVVIAAAITQPETLRVKANGRHQQQVGYEQLRALGNRQAKNSGSGRDARPPLAKLQWLRLFYDYRQHGAHAHSTPVPYQVAWIEFAFERPVQGNNRTWPGGEVPEQGLRDRRLVARTLLRHERHALRQQFGALCAPPIGQIIGRSHAAQHNAAFSYAFARASALYRAALVAANMLRMKRLIACQLAVTLCLLGAATATRAGCQDKPAAGVNWTDCEKLRLILRKAELQGAKLVNTDLNGSDLEGSNLSGADLTRASVDRVRLSGADLSRAKLVQLSGYRAKFTKAKLAGADLTKAELARAVFVDADFTGANLSKAEMQRASLEGAVLSGVNLTGADLARANLVKTQVAGAQLAGARIYRARIEGVDFSAALGLTQVQIDTACGDKKTLLPKGLKTPAAWPCAKED